MGRRKFKHLARLLLLGFLFFIIPKPVSAEKKPFTIETLYRIKSIGNLSLSSDGRYLAFRLTRYYLKKGKSNSDIYLLDLKTNRIRRLTYNEKADYSPIWEGGCIYFVSTRKDGPQIWKLCPGKGEPRQITHFPTGISTALLHRGKIFFTSRVFPECMANAKCNKRLEDKMKKGPVQAHLATSFLFRHWDHYRDFKYTHIFLLQNGNIKPLTSGRHDFPPFSLDAHKGMDISPDGNFLVYEAKMDPAPALSTNFDLYLLNLNSGKTRCLTCKNRAWDGHPKFSPNGRYIGFIMQKIPGYESDRFRLAIYDMKTGQIKVLTENYDNWVDDFVWAPDSQSIYFKTEEKAHYPIYRINIATGKMEKVLDAKAIREFLITPDGKSLLITRTSIKEPVEIWKYSIEEKKLQRLTFFNKEIEDKYDIRPAEEHWIKGADGHPIHLFIIKPHNFNPRKRYPLILNIHGGPQQMWSDSFRGDWQIYPGAGYVVAFANPHGSPGYGQKFVEAISGDWGGKVMKDIMKVANYLASLPYVDRNRMGAMGWSWGGYAIMWLEGHTTRFKALAAMMGVYNLRAMFSATEELWFPLWEMKGAPWDAPELYRKFSPSNFVKNFKTPCLIITGERDYRVPYTQSIQFFTDLQLMKVPSMLIIFKNDGHWPNYVKSMPVYYNAHLEWFHKYLGGAPAPYSTEKLIRNLQFKEWEKSSSKN